MATATAPALAAAVEGRVLEVIDSPPLPYPVRLLAASHLGILRDFCRTRGRAEWLPLLSLAGYAQIRNLILILANICNAEALLSLDDDEVIADPDFLVKVDEDLELLGREHPRFWVGRDLPGPRRRRSAPGTHRSLGQLLAQDAVDEHGAHGTGTGQPPPETHLPRRFGGHPGPAHGYLSPPAVQSRHHPG